MSDELDEEINLESIINYIKNNKRIITYSIVLLFISLGIIVRVLSIPHYNNRLLGLDPYLFYRYSRTLLENGSLPVIDSLRYFPDGFRTFKEHQMVTYFVVFLYSTLSPLFGGELINYSIMYPVISFAISMVFFFLMVRELFNKRTAIIATGFLSLAPSYLFRTIAGFADKEAMATMFWFSMIYFLIKSLKAHNNKMIIIYGLISGLLGGLSGLTWGGANFLYISIGLTFIIIVMINRLRVNESISYFCWLIPTLLINALMTERYGGFGLIKQEMFLIPLLSGALIIFRLVSDYLGINKRGLSFQFNSIIIITISLIIAQLTGLFNVIDKFNGIIKTIIIPFGDCPFCVSVTENQAPYFIDPVRGIDWWQRLQWFIPLFIIGSLLLITELFKDFNKGKIIIISAFIIFELFFMFSKFINNPSYVLVNNFFSSTYLLTLPLLVIIMVLFFINNHKSNAWKKFSINQLLIISWFALSIIATRGAIRVIFASTPVFVLIAAFAIDKLYVIINNRTHDAFYSSIPYLIASLIITWCFFNSYHSGAMFWPSFTNDWDTAMSWVRNNTNPNAVFTHWWDYGYWVQTMGKRATTVDGGNFFVKRDEIIGGLMMSGYNLTEVYESLRQFNGSNHLPDYLLLVDDDVLKYVQMANIGGRPGYYSVFAWNNQRVKNNYYLPDTYSSLGVLQSVSGYGMISDDIIINNKLWPHERTFVVNVLLPMTEDNKIGQPLAFLVNGYTNEQTIIPFNCICRVNEGCTYYNVSSLNDCVEFIDGGVIFIPSKLRDRFFTQLFLLNKSIPGFNRVYSTNAGLNVQTIASQQDPTEISIYEINYDELSKWVSNGSPAW